MHNMSDGELFLRVLAKVQSLSQEKMVTPKVVFMFLTPGPVPLAPLWESFFRGHEGLYSIYVHTHPSYNESMPLDSPFHGRRISSQVDKLSFKAMHLN